MATSETNAGYEDWSTTNERIIHIHLLRFERNPSIDITDIFRSSDDISDWAMNTITDFF